MKKKCNASWHFPWGWLFVICFIIDLALSYVIFHLHHVPALIYDVFVCSTVALVIFLLGWWITSGIDKMDNAILRSHHSMRKYY